MALIGFRSPLTYHPWPWSEYTEEQKSKDEKLRKQYPHLSIEECEYSCAGAEFYICDIAFICFDSCNDVFIHIIAV